MRPFVEKEEHDPAAYRPPDLDGRARPCRLRRKQDRSRQGAGGRREGRAARRQELVRGRSRRWRRDGHGQPRSPDQARGIRRLHLRSEEHTSELQSLMRISYAVFCLKKNKQNHTNNSSITTV